MEVCFCGWMGDLEDRTPIYGHDEDDWALGCPLCGRIDRVFWLTDQDRRAVLAEAERRMERKREGMSTTASAMAYTAYRSFAPSRHDACWTQDRNRTEP